MIHLLSTVILFLLTMKLSNDKLVVSFITAAIFALSPMHVESVVWVSERKDVLYSAFFLSSLLTYTHYIDRKGIAWLGLSGILFLLSCLSKAMAVSLVPCLVLIDYLKHRDFKSLTLYLEKVPYLLVGLLTGLIAMDVQSGGDFHGILATAESANAMQKDLGLSDRLVNAAYANYYYLKSFVLPTSLSPFHPYPSAQSINPLITSSAGIGLVMLLLLGYLKDWRHLVFGLSFYLATIALVLQLIPVGSAVVAERYTYLPYIGLAYSFGYLLQRLSQRLSQYNQSWIPYLVTPILLIFLVSQTRTQSDIWQDQVTLFSQAVERYPDDPYSREYLASGYWQQEELDSAIYHVKYAINTLGLVKSSSFELLANCYSDKGEHKKAIAFYNEAIRLDEANSTARYHRGLLLLDHDPLKAIEDFDYCEHSGNTYIQPLIYPPRGRAHGLVKNYEKAIADFNKAIELYPNDINSYLDRAVTYEYMGLVENAKNDYAVVLDIEPKEPLANDRYHILSETTLRSQP